MRKTKFREPILDTAVMYGWLFGDHQSGQKKIPHPRNERDEEEMLFAKTFGKTTPGPSMGWNE